MLRIAAALVALAVGATVVWAQNLEVIKQRREVMRAIAKASSVNFKMAKGETPFDLATVQSRVITANNPYRFAMRNGSSTATGEVGSGRCGGSIQMSCAVLA